MLTDHRALTLLPHWAHAVAHLGKRIENRKRPIPEAMVGARIAIHAGATLPKGWIAELRKHAAVWGDDGRRVRGEPRYLPTAGTPDGWCVPVARRAIVATAVIRPHDPQPGGWHLSAAAGDLHRPPRVPPWADVNASDWWALDDVRTLAVPVPVARGQLGLWRLDRDTVDAVNAQDGGL